MQTKRTFVLSALTAAALGALTVSASAADAPKIAVDLTTLTSPFWTAYNKYIVSEAKAQGVDLLATVQLRVRHGETDHRGEERDHARRQGHHFLAIRQFGRGNGSEDGGRRQGGRSSRSTSRPTSGPVAIVVRANNVAYGEKACKYIGEHVAEGPVVQIMGDQASINGRDRGNGFRDCIKKNYPKLKLLEIPTKAWSGEDAAAGLDTILNSTPDLKAIYMHAGGVFLAPTLQTLKRKGMLASGRRKGPHRHRQQ